MSMSDKSLLRRTSLMSSYTSPERRLDTVMTVLAKTVCNGKTAEITHGV